LTQRSPNRCAPAVGSLFPSTCISISSPHLNVPHPRFKTRLARAEDFGLNPSLPRPPSAMLPPSSVPHTSLVPPFEGVSWRKRINDLKIAVLWSSLLSPSQRPVSPQRSGASAGRSANHFPYFSPYGGTVEVLEGLLVPNPSVLDAWFPIGSCDIPFFWGLCFPPRRISFPPDSSRDSASR